MELRHLHYFLKIAETLSFTQAAAALRVTQPTLSHQIKQLEQEIGTPLFDRVGRSIQITEAGRIFRGHAQRALHELESGLASVNELEGLIHGHLRIGVFRSFGNSLLPAVLADFHRAHPGVRLSMQQMSLADMENALGSGDIDFAITTYLPATSEKLVSEELFTEPLVLAVGPEHELYGRASVRLEALENMPLILRPAGTPSRQLIENCFAARGVAPRVVMEMSSGDATLATIRCSRLATICAGRALAGAPGLATIRIQAPELRRSGAILWHVDRHRPTAAVILAEMAKRAYAQIRPDDCD
ncbi:MAG: LysR family transcriptional regulator [Burkholderiales bacterium]|jgi:LysR family cyn operon transcriptional activator|nr:LysR family transcriptional regulator [Burkholderiales bacterium]